MIRSYLEFQSGLNNLLSNGNGSICPTLINSPWGEAQCFQTEEVISAQVSWWRDPPSSSWLAKWIVEECALTEYEALMLVINNTLYHPFNCWKDGVCEYGLTAEWDISFNRPKSWGQIT